MLPALSIGWELQAPPARLTPSAPVEVSSNASPTRLLAYSAEQTRS